MSHHEALATPPRPDLVPTNGPQLNDPVLEVRNLGVTYGHGTSAVHALEDISLTAAPGEIVCIVGPSGCGKTTLLKSMSGLLRPTRGATLVRGIPVDGPPRQMALVFQEYTKSLLPWLTVEANVTFPLAAQGISKTKRRATAYEALAEVGLAGFETKYPWQLSGGMQQRTAIARAIAYQPSVLLMDEPFASVDAQTRADLEDLVLRIRDETGLTVIFVTHDIDESVYLGDRVIVLSNRPTLVRETITVDLPTQRNQVDTKAEPRFVELRTRILRHIQNDRTPTTHHH